MRPPVDIVGMGVVSAAGSDLVSFWQALREGRLGAAEDPDLSAAGARTPVSARVRGLPEGADPLRFAVEAALRDAGPMDAPPERIALVVGTSAGGMPAAERFFRELAAGRVPDASLAHDATYPAPALALARALGVRGPVEVVCAACASSLVAVGLARDLLLDGACDVAVAAGHDRASLFVHAGFDALGALSRSACRPFSVRRDGLLAGEGAGAVVLVRASDRPSRARVTGFGASSDARHVTAPDPEGEGLAEAIRAALADAGKEGRAVDFVSAHGTGTQHNDAAEARALHRALGDRAREVPVVSWKPILGHAMGAAGALELAGLVLALESGILPGTPSDDAPDEACDLDIVAGLSRAISARVALKVSSGFGGANAALVVERP